MKALKVLSGSRQWKVYPLLGNDHDAADDDYDPDNRKSGQLSHYFPRLL